MGPAALLRCCPTQLFDPSRPRRRAVAEFKLRVERGLFEGTNVAVGVMLLPFQVLGFGLRKLGWAHQDQSATGLVASAGWGSTDQNASAQQFRFLMRELAELRQELGAMKAHGRQASVPGHQAGGPPELETAHPATRPAVRRMAPPAPPPPPPQQQQQLADKPQAAAAAAPLDLLSAIRAAGGKACRTPGGGGGLRAAPAGGTPSAPTPPGDAPPPSSSKNFTTATSGRPNMASIVPATPPKLRKTEHSPGGTPVALPPTMSMASDLDSILSKALHDKFR